MNRFRRRGRESDGGVFGVRTWRRGELEQCFASVGPTKVTAEGYLTLNTQTEHLDMLPRRARTINNTSRVARAAANRLHTTLLADSVWVDSTRSSTGKGLEP